MSGQNVLSSWSPGTDPCISQWLGVDCICTQVSPAPLPASQVLLQSPAAHAPDTHTGVPTHTLLKLDPPCFRLQIALSRMQATRLRAPVSATAAALMTHRAALQGFLLTPACTGLAPNATVSRVYGLLLSSMLVTQGSYLSGALPAALGSLSQLRYLVLSNQNFTARPLPGAAWVHALLHAKPLSACFRLACPASSSGHDEAEGCHSAVSTARNTGTCSVQLQSSAAVEPGQRLHSRARLLPAAATAAGCACS